jgi:hypothetical protein
MGRRLVFLMEFLVDEFPADAEIRGKSDCFQLTVFTNSAER